MWGDRPLFDELVERFDEKVVRDTAAEYVQAKLAERDSRHSKAGESRYLVEPNVKDGKGGLRDLHTLFWIGKVPLSGAQRGRTGRKGRLHAQGISAVPQGRGLPVGGALPHALPDRAPRRAAAFRHPARNCRTARLYEASRPAGRRALHEALLPQRQDRRRPDPHLLRRAGGGTGQGRSGLQPDLPVVLAPASQIAGSSDFS